MEPAGFLPPLLLTAMKVPAVWTHHERGGGGGGRSTARQAPHNRKSDSEVDANEKHTYTHSHNTATSGARTQTHNDKVEQRAGCGGCGGGGWGRGSLGHPPKMNPTRLNHGSHRLGGRYLHTRQARVASDGESIHAFSPPPPPPPHPYLHTHAHTLIPLFHMRPHVLQGQDLDEGKHLPSRGEDGEVASLDAGNDLQAAHAHRSTISTTDARSHTFQTVYGG